MQREMLHADGSTALTDDPAPQMRDAISDSGCAVLLLQAPTERILAASPAAGLLLNPNEPTGLVGSLLSELTVAGPAEDSTLLAGRLNGYETRRVLRGAESGHPLDIWLRAIDDESSPPLVLAILSPADRTASWSAESADPVTSTVIGAVNEALQLDRVSDNVESFLGLPPADVLGQSLLRLVAADDVADLMFALARAAGTRQGVGLTVRMLGRGRREQHCQLVILPLASPPSCAFALQPVHPVDGGTLSSAEDVNVLLRRLGEGIQAASTARELTDTAGHRVAQLTELTARESQIVSRLLDGDRVPAIARQLFLAQSTVRNHLSAVFSKLGVRSQQELIVLMRRSQAPSSDG